MSGIGLKTGTCDIRRPVGNRGAGLEMGRLDIRQDEPVLVGVETVRRAQVIIKQRQGTLATGDTACFSLAHSVAT